MTTTATAALTTAAGLAIISVFGAISGYLMDTSPALCAWAAVVGWSLSAGTPESCPRRHRCGE